MVPGSVPAPDGYKVLAVIPVGIPITDFGAVGQAVAVAYPDARITSGDGVAAVLIVADGTRPRMGHVECDHLFCGHDEPLEDEGSPA